VWEYPKPSHLKEVIDWTGIPIAKVQKPILQLAQDSANYRAKGNVEYVLTIRDLKQFTELYRIWLSLGSSPKRILEKALKASIFVKSLSSEEDEIVNGYWYFRGE